jgi:hypothetical protein
MKISFVHFASNVVLSLFKHFLENKCFGTSKIDEAHAILLSSNLVPTSLLLSAVTAPSLTPVLVFLLTVEQLFWHCLPMEADGEEVE